MKAVILAGGTGTRLWPLSRKDKPKQFLPLGSDKTMLQETYERIGFLDPKDIYIATNKEFEKEIKSQLPEVPHENIILEPALRDTATCIGFAAMKLSLKGEEDVMAVIYADHLVKNSKQFEEKIKIAEKVAQKDDTLNIIEVKATYPNVNLGYVKVGEKIDEVEGNEILKFEQFTEKPDIEKAKKFVESGKYLWNTGMYVWRIDTILEKYAEHLPDTYKKLMKMKESIGTPHENETIDDQYGLCEKISIDYAIMEKVKPEEVRIIPADFGWSDVGTWESIHEELAKTNDGNIVIANHHGIQTKGSLIRTDNPNKFIATIGLDDIVIIDTKDALLVCKKDKSQDVKKIVEELKKKGLYL